jgi:hypothetical protein
MNASVHPALDRDAARARYTAPGVLELRLRGRLSLEVLRIALRELEALTVGYPAARQLMVDASELVALDRVSPGTLAHWLADYAPRFDRTAFVASSGMVRMTLAAIAARIPHAEVALVSNRAEAFIRFDDALMNRALGA